jgi:hypothetical protein
MMIDHTQKHVVTKPQDSLVNIEIDVMSKYATSANEQFQTRMDNVERSVSRLQTGLVVVSLLLGLGLAGAGAVLGKSYRSRERSVV